MSRSKTKRCLPSYSEKKKRNAESTQQENDRNFTGK